MDSFNKFVSPAMLSLTDSYAVKILIAYFLKEIDRPITPQQLVEIATADGIINYFSYTEAINSMIETKTIELDIVNGEECYALTQMGKDGADSFKNIVPKSFRDKILEAGLQFFAKIKLEHDVKVEIEKNETGYTVLCKCYDMNVVLMDLKLFAPDIAQAELIKENIIKNPTAFYGNVLNYVINVQ